LRVHLLLTLLAGQAEATAATTTLLAIKVHTAAVAPKVAQVEDFLAEAQFVSCGLDKQDHSPVLTWED
jgi:hypothetical protein